VTAGGPSCDLPNAARVIIQALDLTGDLLEECERVDIAIGEELEQLLLEDADVDLEGMEGVSDFVRDARSEGFDQALVRVAARWTRPSLIAHSGGDLI
jgi:hypothetical protein